MYAWALLAVVVVTLVNTVEGKTCYRVICTSERRRVCVWNTWQGCCAYSWKWVAVTKKKRYCCSGYKGRNCVTPICNPECENGGKCIAPGVCRCENGFAGPACRGDAPCSRRSPCYPGICDQSCSCQNGFTEKTCLQLSDQPPQVWQSRVRLVSKKVSNDPKLNGMMMYELITDSSNPNENEEDEIWSNQQGFNYLEMSGAAQFDPQGLYPKPRYVGDAEFGVTRAVAKLVHTKLRTSGGGRFESKVMEYQCINIERKNIASYWNCTSVDDKFSQLINNADELEVTFTFKSGGYRQLVDPDTKARIVKQTYRELSAEKKMKFKFDLEPPRHCSEQDGPCGRQPLFVDQEITRRPVQIRWDGWDDSLSQMYRYAWEVFKLEPYTVSGELREPEPLKPLVNKGWFVSNGTLPVVYTPPSPGLYSVILEASDLANNSRYARRLFLFDNVSDITVSDASDARLFVSSAADNAGNKWQADLNNDVIVRWSGHFVNEIHHKNKLLNKVLEYPTQFADIVQEVGPNGRFTQKSIAFDDREGKRTLDAIPNDRGIVTYEIAYNRDHEGGATLTSPPPWKPVSDINSQSFVITGQRRTNGDSIRVWVRATDIMGSQKIDDTLVSFDDSIPTFVLKPLQKNVDGGKYPYSSIVPATAFDEESGIWGVTWQVSRESTGEVKNTGQLDLTPYRISKRECDTRPAECRCTPTSECFLTKFDIHVNHCWLVVTKESLRTENIVMEINVTNPAMLTNTRTLTISDLPTFKGIGEYAPPRNVRVIRGGFNTVRISWNNTPSCYNITELWVNYTGESQKEKIHRKSSFYDLTGLQPETNYTAHLITGYSGEMSDPVEFIFRTGPAPEPAGLSSGAKAGIGIGVFLFIIIIIVGVILLWHFGIIAVALGRKKEGPMTKAAVAFSRMSRRVRGAAVDDDIYVFGGDNFDIPLGVQISASRLTLEELIAEGQFARIYQASLSTGETEKKTVVAKMLKEPGDPDDRQLMKGKILFYLNEVGENRNILRMIGTVLENEDWGPMMVLEYCEIGPMRTWLVKQKGAVTDDVIERLFQFAYGIVQGMVYLTQAGIVHRRLAARNILLTFLLEVRISGFGPTNMAEGEGEENATDNSKKERIPLRWVAPECFRSLKDASEKSDVWSYGIVLWEIFSLGDNPYPTLKTHEIPAKVKTGHRMNRPEFADEFNYDLMQRCWVAEAKKRPKFRDLEKSYNTLMTGGSSNNYSDNYANYAR